MWQGKPVSEWTEWEKSQFLHLLREKCWHEKDLDISLPTDTIFICKHCKKFIEPFNYFTDSGFFPVKRFMEQSLPEVWEGYLETYIADMNDPLFCSKFVNWFIDLTNLVTFLIEHREEWGWIECPNCNGQLAKSLQPKCVTCFNIGKVKHPERYKAIEFAEGVK
jgi:hypothetical protein